MKPQTPQGRGVRGDFIVPKKLVRPPATVNEVPSHQAPKVEPLRTPELLGTSNKPKKPLKRLKTWFFEIWRPALITLLVGLIICSMLGFQIGGLTKGISSREQQYIANIDSGREVLSNPSFLVHKLPTYILFKLGAERVAYYRLVSAAIGALAVLSCFYVLRRWYTTRVALIGSWLLLSSAWLLHVTRLALPESSLLLFMPLLWSAVWLYTTKRRQYALSALCIIGVLCVYVPGFVWLVAGLVAWQRKTILSELKQVKLWFKIAAALCVLIGMAPLAYGASQNPQELLLIAGLPDSLPSIKAIGLNFVNIPVQLLVRGPDNPELWLGRLPLLDVFTAAMAACGVYSLRYQLKLIRTQMILVSSIAFVLMIGLGGPVGMIAILGIVYLLAGTGISFFLKQWFTVFPRNPFARGLATTLVSITVGLVSYYHISHYFIAWPQTPATRAVFTESLIK